MRNLFKWSLILVAAIIVISVIADHWLLAIIVVLAGAALFFFKRRNEKATIAKNKEKMRSERPKLGDSYEDVLRYVTTYAEKIYSQDRSGIIADIDWFGDGDIYRVSLPLYAIKLSIRDYISKKDYDLGCVGWQWKSEQFARLYRGLVSEYQLVFPDGYSDSRIPRLLLRPQTQTGSGHI